MTIYRACATDCIYSIAAENGYDWETVWSHPNNELLRKLRGSPACLAEGDEVFIPERRLKRVSVATGQKHRFLLKGVPVHLRLRLRDEEGAPRSGLDYEVEVDGVRHRGKTDAEGRLEVPVRPSTTRGVLRLYQPDQAEVGGLRLIEEKRLLIGGLNPTTGTDGVQARLRNLGYYHGPIDADFGPFSRDALQRFQLAEGLEPTGDLDETTRAALFHAHRR